MEHEMWTLFVNQVYELVVREVEHKQNILTTSAEYAGDMIATIISNRVEYLVADFSNLTLIRLANLRNVWGDVWSARHTLAHESMPLRMALETIIAKELEQDVSDRIYGV